MNESKDFATEERSFWLDSELEVAIQDTTEGNPCACKVRKSVSPHVSTSTESDIAKIT